MYYSSSFTPTSSPEVILEATANKALSQRYMIMAALSLIDSPHDNAIEIRSFLDSGETDEMLRGLNKLMGRFGIAIEKIPGTVSGETCSIKVKKQQASYSEDIDLGTFIELVPIRYLPILAAALNQDQTIKMNLNVSDEEFGLINHDLSVVCGQLGVVFFSEEKQITLRGGITSATGKIRVIEKPKSSQCYNALALVSPLLPQGLSVEFVNGIPSPSYYKLTLAGMRERLSSSSLAPVISENGAMVGIAPAHYQFPQQLAVTGDYNAVAIHALLAFNSARPITLRGLNPLLPQGEKRCLEWLPSLGISVTWNDEGDAVTLQGPAQVKAEDYPPYDLSDAPNLYAPLMAMAMMAPTGAQFCITGLKEDHFSKAEELSSLLREMGASINTDNGVIVMQGGNNLNFPDKFPEIQHGRNAIMLAILAGIDGKRVFINDLDNLARKEYGATFCQDMEEHGFHIQPAPYVTAMEDKLKSKMAEIKRLTLAQLKSEHVISR